MSTGIVQSEASNCTIKLPSNALLNTIDQEQLDMDNAKFLQNG